MDGTPSDFIVGSDRRDSRPNPFFFFLFFFSSLSFPSPLPGIITYTYSKYRESLKVGT